MFNPDEVRFLGWQGNLGYARRVSPTTTVDAGAALTRFRAPYPGGREYHYTEFYVGVIRDPLLARLSYSPDYFREGAHTVYGEVEATLPVTRNLSLNAHAGLLTFVSTREEYALPHSTYYDWRLGAMQRFGRFELHAAVSGGGPGAQFYRGRRHSRTRLTAGASWNF